MPLDSNLFSPLMLWLFAIVLVAALVHGTTGFGFPVVSTPVVAMLTDVRTAIVVTVLPNLVVNLVSIMRGGNWNESLGRYWPVAAWVLVGAVIGTRLLVLSDPEPLKLLLSLMILVYLMQDLLNRRNWSWLARAPRLSAMAAGLLGGFLSGAVNIALPPLVIYFMALGLAPLAMTQILNLCFISGKITQAATLAFAGHMGVQVLLASVPLCLVAAAGLALGMRIQSRIHPQFYRKAVKIIMLAIALALLGQVAMHYLLK